MIEIGIGVLFAALFVVAYLLVSRLLGRGGRLREIANQPLGSKLIASKSTPLFLKTGEMSEHHSKKR
ncbi:MAG TPA: hypothetical protein VF717_08510 [Pyrinomonadaceae bacterium]|jgi:hypothetical protein